MPTIELWSIGDGAYLYAVLNAVAMIKSYPQIGAIGMMLGLIVMGIRSAMSGGTEFEPKWLLLSAVLFAGMFGARVDHVVVHELMPAPGEVTAKSYVVDNVPAGPALLGFVISSIGYHMTQVMETSFGSATDTNRVTSGGLGRNLRLIMQVRAFGDPSTADKEGELPAYRRTLGAYYHDCTTFAANHGALAVDRETAMVHNPDPIDAISAPNPNVDTVIYRAGAEPYPASCKDATAYIRTFTDTKLVTVTSKAMADSYGQPTMVNDAISAMAAYGADMSGHAHQLIASSILSAIQVQAQAEGWGGTDKVALLVMTEEAAAKRNAQFAGEESLFNRLMRPTASFFEALAYALAPFMALALGLGRYGFGLIGKWAMFGLWVTLWFPILSIISLYSNIQMEHFVGSLDAASLTSQAHVQMMVAAASDGLGTAAALAASTPFLAISLLYGGAVAATSLASRLQGADLIDETKMAPTTSQTAPISQETSDFTHSATGGLRQTGGDELMPRYSMRSEASESLSTVHARQESSTASWGQTLTDQTSSLVQAIRSGSVGTNSTNGQSFNESIGQMAKISVDNGWSNQEDATAAQKAAQAISGKAGIPGPVGADYKESAEKLAQFVQGFSENAKHSASQGSDFNAGVAHNASTAIVGAIQSSGAFSDSSQRTTALSKSLSDAESVSATYQSGAARVSAIAAGEDIKLNNFGYKTAAAFDNDRDRASDYVSRHVNNLSPEMRRDYEDNLAAASNVIGNSGNNQLDRRAAALAMTYFDTNPADVPAADRVAFESSKLDFISTVSTRDPTVVHPERADEGSSLASHVRAGEAHAAAANVSGSGISEAQVRGAANAAYGGGSAQIGSTAGEVAHSRGELEAGNNPMNPTWAAVAEHDRGAMVEQGKDARGDFADAHGEAPGVLDLNELAYGSGALNSIDSSTGTYQSMWPTSDADHAAYNQEYDAQYAQLRERYPDKGDEWAMIKAIGATSAARDGQAVSPQVWGRVQDEVMKNHAELRDIPMTDWLIDGDPAKEYVQKRLSGGMSDAMRGDTPPPASAAPAAHAWSIPENVRVHD